jgi:hypothetical protein
MQVSLKPDSPSHPPVHVAAGATGQCIFAELTLGSAYEIEAVAIVEQSGATKESVAAIKAITIKVLATHTFSVPCPTMVLACTVVVAQAQA